MLLLAQVYLDLSISCQNEIQSGSASSLIGFLAFLGMSAVPCCSGSTHPGETKGVTGNLHGFPTYIAAPSNNAEIKGIVVMIPDAFGWEFVNLRLLADTFAERLGVRCLLPEFMGGKLQKAMNNERMQRGFDN